MYRSDEEALRAALQVLGQDPPPADPLYGTVDAEPPPAPESKRRVAIALVVILLVTLLVGALLNRTDSGATEADTASSTVPAPPPGTTVPAVGAITVEGELLGAIRGTRVEDDVAVAYPGQPVTAPRPRRGEAVGWQWELCDPDCTVIGGARQETWASPPTPEPVEIRVVVQVDLDGAQIRVASEPYRAMPWPDESTSSEAPSTTARATTTTERATSTTDRATTTAVAPTTAAPTTTAAPA